MYKTNSGKEKQRKDLIGVLHGSKNTLTGIIDVVSVNSIYDKAGISRLSQTYGMVVWIYLVNQIFMIAKASILAEEIVFTYTEDTNQK